MRKYIQMTKTVLVFAFAAIALLGLRPAMAASGAVLDQDAKAALDSLYANSPGATALGQQAAGILVFPRVTRLGFIIGGQGGDGALVEHGKVTGHYSTGALSVGMEAGAQTYGYALFFMKPADLHYLKTSKGWSLGVGPTIVVADAGMAKDASTMTGKSGVYAFIFDQKGLMAGIGLTGQKITKIK